jgi:predicted RNA-binding Zn-ribbon protein involved in translation (DUF1610 family)
MSLLLIINILLILTAVFFIARWIYFDAKLRGMNPWLWVLLTVFLSPNFIGLIIYLLVRNPVQTIKCKHCHADISRSVVYCPSCGTKIIYREEPVSRKNHTKFLIIGIILLLVIIIAGIVGIAARSYLANKHPVSTNIFSEWDRVSMTTFMYPVTGKKK